MKKLNLLASAILLVATVVSCGVDIYNKEPRHRGEKDIKITSIKCDTVYMDGSSLSLEGSWIMKEDTLVWFDKYTHGAHLFSMDGKYITRRIEKGDGPNDMKTYPWAVCADGNDGIITPRIFIVTIVITVIPRACQMQFAFLAGSLAL